MDSKEKYRALCRIEQSIPVWNRDWWLDAVCGDEWELLTVEKNGQIVAALPYVKTQGKFGLMEIRMPKLTQTLGVWIKYPEGQKYVTKISYEIKIYSELIEQLEDLNVSCFFQNFSNKVTNWLPFLWKGYDQSTRYSYVINNLDDIDEVFQNFKNTKRHSIKKAEEVLTVAFDLSSEDFYEHHEKSLRKKDKVINYDYELFSKIYDFSYKNNSGKSIYCFDDNNNIHSAVFLVSDNESVYYLISSVDTEFRNGGNDLLLFEAIKFAAGQSKRFDFEGSVMEGVEKSYRNFGGEQVPYFSISKTYSPRLIIDNGLKQVLCGIKMSIKNIIR